MTIIEVMYALKYSVIFVSPINILDYCFIQNNNLTVPIRDTNDCTFE